VQLQPDFRGAIWSEVNVLISGGDAQARLRTAQWIHDYTHPGGGAFLIIGAEAPRALLKRLRSFCRDKMQGTVFIEEVGQLDEKIQTGLLELVQACANHAVRIVAGSGCDLFALVSSAGFSGDLFYRLNSVHLTLETQPLTVYG
jgi:transcriptional regulator of acetoin/glycerol metabolism